VSTLIGNIPTTGHSVRKKLGELSPLLAASLLVQASNAAITTMIAIVISQRGGEQSDVSLIAACYALGFMLGCFVTPSQVFRVGLIRAYAAAAAVVTMAIVGLDLLEGSIQWAFLRFMMGASIAAVLAISDAWMNSNTPIDLRGRVIAIYSIVMGVGALASQMIFLVADAETDDLVLVFAIVMNFAVVLVALTSSSPPTIEPPPKRQFRFLTITSKTASISAFVSGFATVSIISILPFYLTEHGVDGELVALSLAALYLGRLIFQWPVGALSDRLDRRTILVALSAVVALAMVGMILVGPLDGAAFSGELGPLIQGGVFLYVLLLGGMLFPIYSVASTLAFDRAEGKSMIDISTSLLVIYSLGSIAGPFTVMAVSEIIEGPALPVSILVACALIIGTGLFRRVSAVVPTEHVPSAVITPESSVEMVQAAAAVIEEQTND
jgi:MFS family permease